MPFCCIVHLFFKGQKYNYFVIPYIYFSWVKSIIYYYFVVSYIYFSGVKSIIILFLLCAAPLPDVPPPGKGVATATSREYNFSFEGIMV